MDWFRSHHGAPTDPKWRTVAKRAGVAPGFVVSLAWALLDEASQASDRGSIASADVETLADFMGYEVDDVERVIAVMVEKGILTQSRWTAWERRQVKQEDERAASRQAAKRQRDKAKSEESRSGDRDKPSDHTSSQAVTDPDRNDGAVTACHGMSRDVTESHGLSRSVTPPSRPVTVEQSRTEQIDNPESAAPYDPGRAAAAQAASSVDQARAKRVEPPADSGGTEAFRSTQRACVEALGGYLPDGIAPSDAHFGPMMALVDQGAALPAVLTALRSIRERPSRNPIKTWSLFATKVAEALAGNPKLGSAAPAAAKPPTTYVPGIGDVPTTALAAGIARWKRGGVWNPAWNFPPDDERCAIPSPLLGPVVVIAGTRRWEAVVERVMALWNRDGVWPALGWGPSPEDPDCAVPARYRRPPEAA